MRFWPFDDDWEVLRTAHYIKIICINWINFGLFSLFRFFKQKSWCDSIMTLSHLIRRQFTHCLHINWRLETDSEGNSSNPIGHFCQSILTGKCRKGTTNVITSERRTKTYFQTLSDLIVISVTRRKSPNIYKSCPKMISLEKWYILIHLQKLPKNVGYLGKIIVAKGFKKLPKVQ